jgi:phosphoglycolate phosphatase-like HAD superfamily hydrolase
MARNDLRTFPAASGVPVRVQNTEPGACAFVGDSTTDIEAARLVGVPSIGYANRPGKHALLAEAGADTVVSSLADLILVLRARPLPT